MKRHDPMDWLALAFIGGLFLGATISRKPVQPIVFTLFCLVTATWRAYTIV